MSSIQTSFDPSLVDGDDNIKVQEVQVLKSIYYEDFVQEDEDFYKIRIKVDVPDNFQIRIRNQDDEQEGKDKTTSTTSTTTTTTTTTSASETQDESYPIICLPNVTLGFEYPQDYPTSPPILMLSCCWLSLEEMNQVLEYLNSIFEQGEPIIFRYIEWIKSSIVSFIVERVQKNVDDCCIYLSNRPIDYDSPLCEFVSWEHQEGWTSPTSSLPLLLAHNTHESKRVFAMEPHCCPICYCDEDGTKFELFKCGHFICKACLIHMLTINIESGSINSIKCTEPGCGADIEQHLISKYVSKELLDRYNSQMKKTQGFVECTRCKGWGKVDQNTRSTFCGTCYYSMCMLCTKAWHPGVTCNYEAIRSEQAKDQTARPRPCPSCAVLIWKYDGCNKVHCLMCDKLFCWLCLRVISGYEHFESSCVLFEIPGSLQRPPRFVQSRYEGYVTATGQCSRCKSKVFQYSLNNHVFCFQCKGQMCFLCKEMIQGTKHFQTSACSQHGGTPLPTASNKGK